VRERAYIRATVQELLKNGDVDKDDRASIQKLLTERLDINVGTGGLGNAHHAATYISDPALHRNGDDSNENRLSIIRLLIEEGANIEEKTGMHGKALIAASTEGNEKIVQLLLEKGANPNAKGLKFANALQGASANGHVKIVKLLIDKGANLEGTVLRDTLKMASVSGYMPIVELLQKYSGGLKA
jgi:ankyrin repeat protein